MKLELMNTPWCRNEKEKIMVMYVLGEFKGFKSTGEAIDFNCYEPVTILDTELAGLSSQEIANLSMERVAKCRDDFKKRMMPVLEGKKEHPGRGFKDSISLKSDSAEERKIKFENSLNKETENREKEEPFFCKDIEEVLV